MKFNFTVIQNDTIKRPSVHFQTRLVMQSEIIKLFFFKILEPCLLVCKSY